MRAFQWLFLVWPGLAHADQPRGTYTLELGESAFSETCRQKIPSCGEKFPAAATFVVGYFDQIVVNKREWRFDGYVTDPGEREDPKADVIIIDPESEDQIRIAFGTDRSSADGVLQVVGVRSGKTCADAWRLHGTYTRARLPQPTKP